MSQASPKEWSLTRRRMTAVLVLAGMALMLRFISTPPVGAIPDTWALRDWERLGGTAVQSAGAVRQSGVWDCGYAALAMLLRSQGGGGLVLDSLKGLYRAAPGGLTVSEMESLSRAFGVPLRGRSATDNSWLREPTPFILLLASHHYVTVIRRERDIVLIGDPAAGIIQLALDSTRRLKPIVVLART